MEIIITIAITAFIILYAGIYKAERVLLPIALAGLLAALALCVYGWNANHVSFGMLKMDNYALAFAGLGIIGTMMVLGLSKDYFSVKAANRAEYFALILFSLTGMIMMMAYENISMLFIGLEVMSVSLYVLAGINKRNAASNEASLKYFLMGAFSTGFLLFGISLVYGATGSFQLSEIKTYLVNHVQDTPYLIYPGIIIILAGLCFKVGAAPFHFWTPDVYEGSPSLITAFMSTVVKTAGFAAFLRLFDASFDVLSGFWHWPMLVIIFITLLVGNVTALYQEHFKRLLAYSSISHAGYLLFAIVVITKASAPSLLVYAAAYTFASLIAFAVLIVVKQNTGSDNLARYNGLAQNNPFLALTLTIAMLSLAGIPLTAGFMGKYLMFTQVMGGYYIWLLVFAVINALLGFYYYLRIVSAMYFKQGTVPYIPVNWAYKCVIILCACATIVLGFFPNLVYSLLA